MKEVSLFIERVCWSPQRRGELILKPVTMSLEAGQVLGVVGANGAGKSSFLRLLYRYNRPVSGVIKMEQINIWSIPPKEFAQKVAAVLQEHPTDFSLTVREIVALGRIPFRHGFSQILPMKNQSDREIIDNALEYLEIKKFAERKFGTLSGGERQRVMVARAIAQEPGMLIMDEPTNHLDIRHQLEIIRLIRDLEMTIVVSLHDLNMAASICDAIILFHRGETLAFGCPEVVLAEKNVSTAFDVIARRESLYPSRNNHFTYQLS